MNAKMLSCMAEAVFRDLLVRKEEMDREGREIDLQKEGLAPLQMCFKALDMNICVDQEDLFKTCLVKHARPFFSSGTPGREAAQSFVSLFLDFLKEEGDGDLQLARMRTALYRTETLNSFSELLRRQAEIQE